MKGMDALTPPPDTTTDPPPPASTATKRARREDRHTALAAAARVVAADISREGPIVIDPADQVIAMADKFADWLAGR